MGIGRQDTDDIEEPEGAFQQNDIMPGEIFLQIPEFCGSMEGISPQSFPDGLVDPLQLFVRPGKEPGIHLKGIVQKLTEKRKSFAGRTGKFHRRRLHF